MNQNILITVLIPAYNVEKYIKDAIESIIAQTYSNLEIIVVDDCSTDGTFSILEEIKYYEPRLKLFRNNENSGIVKTLNFGLSVSNGEYIVRMDGDDLCHPSKIEKQLMFLLNNENIALVGCDIICIDENGEILNHVLTSHNVNCTKKILNYTSPVLHIWMCKKEIYTILGGYRELDGAEDYDFLLRLDALGYNLYNIPFFGYSVRLRAGNTQSTKGLYQRKIVYYVRKLYKERLIKKDDSFNVMSRNSYTKSSSILEKVHSFSIQNTYKAIHFRKNKNYFMFVFSVLLSFVSPFQIRYYIENILVKYNLKKFNQ